MISRRNERKILAKRILNNENIYQKQNTIRGRSRNLVAAQLARGGCFPHTLETFIGAFSDSGENLLLISDNPSFVVKSCDGSVSSRFPPRICLEI